MPRAEVRELDEQHEEVDIPGVPGGTVVLRYDPEDRATMDVKQSWIDDDHALSGTTIHLPHKKDLETCPGEGDLEGADGTE